MTTLREGEIEFVFGDTWRAEKFDGQGVARLFGQTDSGRCLSREKDL